MNYIKKYLIFALLFPSLAFGQEHNNNASWKRKALKIAAFVGGSVVAVTATTAALLGLFKRNHTSKIQTLLDDNRYRYAIDTTLLARGNLTQLQVDNLALNLAPGAEANDRVTTAMHNLTEKLLIINNDLTSSEQALTRFSPYFLSNEMLNNLMNYRNNLMEVRTALGRHQ